MKPEATLDQVSRVLQEAGNNGLEVRVSRNDTRTVIGLTGCKREDLFKRLSEFPGVEEVVLMSHPFKLASREFRPQKSVFCLGGVNIGGEKVVVMAGPCAVENRTMLLETACAVKEAGASFLRGGAFKPRTSPYSFQGLGEKGLDYLQEAKQKTGLPVVTEVMSPEKIIRVAEVADILQVGTRNMQNYSLLEAVGRANRPVLLKRGMMATVEEFLTAAEYILSNGGSRVILCERGIRTFEKMTRNTLDVAAVPLLQNLSHLPVCVDPSHAGGMDSLVIPLAKAAVAAGADALIVEVHPQPKKALSDGKQSLTPDKFRRMMKELSAVAGAVGRHI